MKTSILAIFKAVNLTKYWGKWYTTIEFYELLKRQCIIDLRLGGLVVGPSHFWGGIFFYTQKDSLFECCGELEGGEFVVNPISTQMYHNRLTEINEDYTNSVKLSSRAINEYRTTKINNNKKQALWITGEVYIINKVSTAKYYEELCEINYLTHQSRYSFVVDTVSDFETYKKYDEQGAFYKFVGKTKEELWHQIKRNTYKNMG